MLNSRNGTSDNIYDCIIVGGGIAAVTAAAQLGRRGSDLNLLLLEKNEYIGGRVCTRSFEGIHYDLGAIIAADPGILPFKIDLPERIYEKDPLGIYYNKSLNFFPDVKSAVNQLLDAAEIGLLKANLSNPESGRPPAAISRKTRQILNAFFKVIHPGEIERYIPERQFDALRRYDTHHFAGGNASVVEALLRSVDADIQLKSAVQSVRQLPTGLVEIVFENDQGQQRQLANSAIVATTAPVAARIIKSDNRINGTFLKTVRYGHYSVVALAVPRENLAPFSYIVTPDLPCDTVLKHRSRHPRYEMVFVYYGDKKSAAIADDSEQQLVEKSMSILAELNIGLRKDVQPAYYDVKRWQNGGTIISANIYNNFDEACLWPSPQICLAGDYTFAEYPFAMYGAIQSGRRAAGWIEQLIQKSAKAI